jgi:hypothetical protein
MPPTAWKISAHHAFARAARGRYHLGNGVPRFGVRSARWVSPCRRWRGWADDCTLSNRDHCHF